MRFEFLKSYFLLSQEQKEVSISNEKHWSLFHKCSLLDIQNKIIANTTFKYFAASGPGSPPNRFGDVSLSFLVCNTYPVGIYLFKINNRNTSTRCEIFQS